MKKPLVLLLLAALLLISAVFVVSAQEDTPDPLLCTEDGSNGITCGTVEDNECFPGGSLAWESATGPCEQGVEMVWVCGWFLARYNADLISTVPAPCEWVLPTEFVPTLDCLANPGTGWLDCLLGNQYFGDDLYTGAGWDYAGVIIPVGDTCPPGTDSEGLVGLVQEDFSNFIVAHGFSATTDKVCFDFLGAKYS